MLYADIANELTVYEIDARQPQQQPELAVQAAGEIVSGRMTRPVEAASR